MTTAHGTTYATLRRYVSELEAHHPPAYLRERAADIRLMARSGLVRPEFALSMLLTARAYLSVARERTTKQRAAA